MYLRLGATPWGTVAPESNKKKLRFRIDPEKFDTLVTKNFSNWEDVRKTPNVEPGVIVRLQDRLADRPEVTGWVQKPGDFAVLSEYAMAGVSPLWPRLAQRRLRHGDTLLWEEEFKFKFGMLDLTTLRLD